MAGELYLNLKNDISKIYTRHWSLTSEAYHLYTLYKIQKQERLKTVQWCGIIVQELPHDDTVDDDDNYDDETKVY